MIRDGAIKVQQNNKEMEFMYSEGEKESRLSESYTSRDEKPRRN